MLEHQRPDCVVHLVEDRHDIFRLGRLRERCEPAQVAEQHRDFAAVTVNSSMPPDREHLASCGGTNRSIRLSRSTSRTFSVTRRSSSVFQAAQFLRLAGDGCEERSLRRRAAASSRGKR